MNPVGKTFAPPKILKSYLNIYGTQYMIIIPLSRIARTTIPETTNEFLKMED